MLCFSFASSDHSNPSFRRIHSRSSTRGLHIILAPDVDDQIWPRHCIQGEEGAELHVNLDVRSHDIIVRKVCCPELFEEDG